jgi:hypothetical protein
MPDREHCAEVADLIAAHHDQFYMGTYASPPGDEAFHTSVPVQMAECGSTACIAGWAQITKTGKFEVDLATVMADATKFLGLTDGQALDLFANIGGVWQRRGMSLADVTAKDAIEILREMADGADVFAHHKELHGDPA